MGSGKQTPIMAATLSGSYDVVQYLLSKGANVKIGEKDGYTPMHGAAFQGRANIAKLLLDHGLDPTARHRDGYSPFHRAAWGTEQRHTDTVRVFLEHGVSVDIVASDGSTAYQFSRNPATKVLLAEWRQKSEKASELSNKAPDEL